MQILNEAQIIIPASPESEARLNSALVLAFGGSTLTHASGSWTNDKGAVVSEPVAVFTVAVPIDAGNTLCALAAKAGEELDQEAMYVKLPTGRVALLHRGTDYGKAAA